MARKKPAAAPALQDRIKELRRVKGRDLIPHGLNYRTHPEAQRTALRGVLEKIGMASALIARETPEGLVLLDGHLRREDYGDQLWPVLVLDVTEEEGNLLLASLDPLAELAEHDQELLEQLLGGMSEEDQDLVGFLYEEEAIVEGLVDPDDVPEAPAEPITKAGDLWILGNHRLLCGDATAQTSWERLEFISEGAVCFTSPPYNLGQSIKLSGNKAMAAGGNAYSNFDDTQTPEHWRQLCDSLLDRSLQFCEAAVFNVQSLAGNRQAILRFLAERPEYRDLVTWDKMHAAPAMAQSVMSSRFEWLAVFGRGKSSRSIPLSRWRGTVPNVYTAPGQHSNEFSGIHGATFPVHLPTWVISELMNGADLVVDCCAGTGTTMIAAEQLGRASCSIEIDPGYCDVIVARWERFTGRKAQLA